MNGSRPAPPTPHAPVPFTPAPMADLVDGRGAPCPSIPGPPREIPVTGEELDALRGSTDARLEAALDAADRVHRRGDWAGRPDAERADLLDAAATAVDRRAHDITRAEAFGSGVPVAQTGLLGVILGGAFRLAAARLRASVLRADAVRPDGRRVTVRREALGPALCVVPYNAPAPMAAHKAASALAAGCPVLVKAPELNPYGTQMLVETAAAALAEAGAPPAVLQLLHGDGATGARLVADDRVRAVSFTGGTPAGREVAAACGHALKPAQLELGGNNALVVMADADTDTAARIAVDLLTTLNGQWCRALGRLVVPAGRTGELLEAIGASLSALRAGDPLDPATGYGPLAHSRHRGAALAATRTLTGLGAKEHSCTPLPERGNWLAPTLITGAPEERARAEIFGPVATVHPYEHLDEAVHLANATGYGLEAYVTGTDEEAALAVAARIRAGEVKVNGSSVLSLHQDTPRPAWGASGLVDEGTDETLLHFTGTRVTGVENGFALHLPAPAEGNTP
ncbi:aldehyde dehydrogenase family protein [Streptomyces sp. NPDC059894]|uniref:aldehyde dehydrogenase family protein n=1 Tax=unclassified Streptomyces TaxID=2593676 RepID=UPI0036634055